MLVDFCLPIKNEEKIIRQNLERLLSYCRQAGFGFSWRVIGVINGSSDGSTRILSEFKKKFPQEVDYFEVPEPGRGGALKRYWLATDADALVYMDADLAVNLDDLHRLIDPIIKNGSDVVIGSRLMAGSSTSRSFGRELVSQTYNRLSRLMLHHRITDLQCGFKAVRAETFRLLSPYLRDDFWFFDTELVILAQRLGHRVREISVDWQENRYEKRPSTVKVFRDSLIFLRNLWSFRRRLAKLRKPGHSV